MNRPLVYLVVSALLLITISSLPQGALITGSGGVGYQEDMPHARILVVDVDGVVLRITPPIYVARAYRNTLKLADLCPTANTTTALMQILEATNYVILLDLDRVTEGEHAVAVAYLRLNGTHILNINKWLVENDYATVCDRPNVFDPSKWILYFEYPSVNEKIPGIYKTTICSKCSILDPSTLGVNVETSLDKKYIAITYTLVGDKSLRVVVLDNKGNTVRNETLTGTSVHLGYVDIAVNETGFFLTWRDDALGPHRARWAYVPYDPALPVYVSDRVFPGGGSWHSAPITAWNPFNESWVVIYGHQTMAFRPRYFINFVNKTGIPAGGTGALWLSPFRGLNGTGLDIQGRLIYDHVSRRFIFTSRNETTPGEYDIEVIMFPADKNDTLLTGDVIRLYVDNRTGPQGPPSSMFNTTFTYFKLYPSIYTSLLGGGRYVLVVYNDTDRSMAYAIVDLSAPRLITRDSLVTTDTPLVFHPWASSNLSHWLITLNYNGSTELFTISPHSEPRVRGVLTLIDRYGSWTRVIYDNGSKVFPITYAITKPGRQSDIYIAFYNTNESKLEPWILPIANTPLPEIPLSTVILSSGESPDHVPGNIGILVLEENDLALYIVNNTYPDSLKPLKGAIPIVEPVEPTPTPPMPTPTPAPPPEVITTTLIVSTTVFDTITVTETKYQRETLTEVITEVKSTTVETTKSITVKTTETRIVTQIVPSVKTITEYREDQGMVMAGAGVLIMAMATSLYFFTHRKR